ncbi:AAA family ATPase [bacterium]|nr:AAA family ATPase [bacterium]
MGRIISIANQKGGVGKTTTAVNLSAALAVAEKRVLLIDLDPQGNATSGMGVTLEEDQQTIYDLMIGSADLDAVKVTTQVPFLELVPASIKLVGAEVELVNVPERESVLRRALEGRLTDYDYVFIDSPPSLGLLTLNGLTLANSVMVPIQCEYYALEGLSKLLNTVRLVQRQLNPSLTIEGAVLTMFDNRLNLSRQVAEEIRTYFAGKVFDIPIQRNVRLSEAPSYGMPVILYDATSRGAENYLALAEEMLAYDSAP